VAVEPLHVEGGQLWAAELATVLVSAAAGPARARIELSIEGVMSGLGRGPARGRTQPATVVPLREVVERLVPASVDARFLVVDAQGFDTAVVLSAGAEQLRRFRYVVIECQELWPEHPARYNPGSPTCSEASRLLASNGSLAFVGCMRNAAINEYNCLFAQRDHAVVGSTERREAAELALANLMLVIAGKATRSPAIPAEFPHSIAAQQLRIFVPEDADARDLTQMMCAMSNHSASPNCRLHTTLSTLNQRKVSCGTWLTCGITKGMPKRHRAHIVSRLQSGSSGASPHCKLFLRRCAGYV
jgi:hypothetical protein